MSITISLVGIASIEVNPIAYFEAIPMPDGTRYMMAVQDVTFLFRDGRKQEITLHLHEAQRGLALGDPVVPPPLPEVAGDEA